MENKTFVFNLILTRTGTMMDRHQSSGSLDSSLHKPSWQELSRTLPENTQFQLIYLVLIMKSWMIRNILIHQKMVSEDVIITYRATTPRCKGGRYSIPWIARLPLILIVLSGINCHFFESLVWLDLELNPGFPDHWCSVCQWPRRPRFSPRSRHSENLKNGTWYLLV